MFTTCTIKQSFQQQKQMKKLNIAPLSYQSISNFHEVSETCSCSICFDQLLHPVLLPCGHTMCYDCIVKCKNSQCPICISPFKVEELQRILIGRRSGKDGRENVNFVQKFRRQEETLESTQKKFNQIEHEKKLLQAKLDGKQIQLKQANKRYCICFACLLNLGVYIMQK
ncbi:C3HC4 type (RING finger) domain-containing protein [Hexamita inflata]|uniref:C3HC4 type (RING finger) domain-containing protein n=1 Tax=Hexamita inflata TaxID=28002 RepID=A0AA86PHY7_9EUKA|nr:C3HC4 type (RING finger) domain-containing protein [Hexamita inflata]CAI9940055.1 C3HC4 type (RING finger) domain-containing protein [Hexamita inflata]